MVYGPPGTGKTTILEKLKEDHLNTVNIYETLKNIKESERNLEEIEQKQSIYKYDNFNSREAYENYKEVIDSLYNNKNSIYFFDDFDKFLMQNGISNKNIKNIVNSITAFFNKITKKDKNNIIILTANDKNEIDPVFKKVGLIEEEIEIPIPDKKTKKDIFRIHSKNLVFEHNLNIDNIIDLTPGFVGEDIVLLIRRAVLNAFERTNNESKEDKIILTNNDFLSALKDVKPNGLKNEIINISNIHWQDIGGLDDIIKKIKDEVVKPIKYQEKFKERNLKSVKGILLSGPPGTGKTLLAKAVANEADFNFISFNAPDIFNKYLGESENNIRKIFTKAAQNAPCVLFIDEIDAIGSERKSERGSDAYNAILNTLLSQINGINEVRDVIVIGATNRSDVLDPALLRSGRFDIIIDVPLPDLEARKNIFEIYLAKCKLNNNKKLAQELAEETNKFSGADIENACMKVAREIVLEEIEKEENNEANSKITNNEIKQKFENVINEINKKTSTKNAEKRIMGFISDDYSKTKKMIRKESTNKNLLKIK
ncbi:MAG: AAA family ATPase [Candidatus Marsarchaeota archaeon]|nr:AAA family ATPase [Candidatus Marsarchaeota archaeon]